MSTSLTCSPKVCKTMAVSATFRGFGSLFYILLGSMKAPNTSIMSTLSSYIMELIWWPGPSTPCLRTWTRLGLAGAVRTKQSDASLEDVSIPVKTSCMCKIAPHGLPPCSPSNRDCMESTSGQCWLNFSGYPTSGMHSFDTGHRAVCAGAVQWHPSGLRAYLKGPGVPTTRGLLEAKTHGCGNL